MPFQITETEMYSLAIGAVVTLAPSDIPLGTRVRAKDLNLGMGEFILLQCSNGGSLIQGQLVTYDGITAGVATYQAVSTTNGSANKGRPVAITMAAMTVGQFGWFQVQGHAIVACGSMAGAGVACYIATGTIQDTQVAGRQLINCISESAAGTPAAGQCYASIAWPCFQTQIT